LKKRSVIDYDVHGQLTHPGASSKKIEKVGEIKAQEPQYRKEVSAVKQKMNE